MPIKITAKTRLSPYNLVIQVGSSKSHTPKREILLRLVGKKGPKLAHMNQTLPNNQSIAAKTVRFMGLAHINNPNKSQRPISAKRRYIIY